MDSVAINEVENAEHEACKAGSCLHDDISPRVG